MIRKISLMILLIASCPFAFAEASAAVDPAVKANHGPTDEQAIGWLTTGAQQGDAFAQFNLGYKYLNGEGVKQDYKKAVYWYTKSAEQGMPEAQVKMGDLYSSGQAVAKDDKQAFDWYTKAAEQGHSVAQNMLGLMYDKGQGVAKNPKTAYAWFSIAAANGNAQALTNRDASATKLSPVELSAAKREAAELIRMIKEKKAAKK